jgi:hypothetical protein
VPPTAWGRALGKVDDHRAVLAALGDWVPYLRANSGLPGPRSNLELLDACGEEADVQMAETLVDSDDEFLITCGVVALGRHLGHGDDAHVGALHALASDSRWRVREAVAMALQRAADDDPDRAFALAERWAADPDPLVRRAAVAAVCEPRLLRTESFSRRALGLVDRVTRDLAELPPANRRDGGLRTLRQALGYAWSVAIAASPTDGLALFGELSASDDPDVAWIVRENHKKARLRRLLGET